MAASTQLAPSRGSRVPARVQRTAGTAKPRLTGRERGSSPRVQKGPRGRIPRSQRVQGTLESYFPEQPPIVVLVAPDLEPSPITANLFAAPLVSALVLTVPTHPASTQTAGSYAKQLPTYCRAHLAPSYKGLEPKHCWQNLINSQLQHAKQATDNWLHYSTAGSCTHDSSHSPLSRGFGVAKAYTMPGMKCPEVGLRSRLGGARKPCPFAAGRSPQTTNHETDKRSRRTHALYDLPFPGTRCRLRNLFTLTRESRGSMSRARSAKGSTAGYTKLRLRQTTAATTKS